MIMTGFEFCIKTTLEMNFYERGSEPLHLGIVTASQWPGCVANLPSHPTLSFFGPFPPIVDLHRSLSRSLPGLLFRPGKGEGRGERFGRNPPTQGRGHQMGPKRSWVPPPPEGGGVTSPRMIRVRVRRRGDAAPFSTGRVSNRGDAWPHLAHRPPWRARLRRRGRHPTGWSVLPTCGRGRWLFGWSWKAELIKDWSTSAMASSKAVFGSSLPFKGKLFGVFFITEQIGGFWGRTDANFHIWPFP